MKKLLKFALLSLAITVLWSCNDDKEGYDTGLEVIPNNIAGTWQLTEQNGAPLAEGLYFYMEITRKDKECIQYQNFDSFSTRIIESTYNIGTDSDKGPFIRGMYKYDNGDWNHRYLVRKLTRTSMTWIQFDDEQQVQVFKRVAKIPEEILSAE